jgi:hypothetical protein
VRLSDITASIYLASDDYKVGTVFPYRAIERIEMADVPVPGSAKKTPKCVIFLRDVPKGWVINKKEARKIAAILNCMDSIEKGWLGAQIALEIVGDVRRPDGTRGNAFRVKDCKPAAFAPTATNPQG